MSKDSNLKTSQPYFSIKDVDEILKRNAKKKKEEAVTVETVKPAVKTEKKKVVSEDPQPKNQKLGAVSVSDILGFSFGEPEQPAKQESEIDRVPKKWLSYYKQLIELRNHLANGLDFHTQDTLHRSSKDDSGDLSSYGQHMADAGTETFDRDFALSLVSSEKEALHEIGKAIERILDGTYGICKVTGKPISKERLRAVPFTRFSVEGQIEFEKTQKKSVQRGGAFAETVEESAAFTSDDDSDD